MASGNHVCKKICADLPIAPINKKNAINDIMLPSMPKIDIVLSFNVINLSKTSS